MNRPTKQVIVMRTDTDPKMRKGKMVAQGGHGVIRFLKSRMHKSTWRALLQILWNVVRGRGVYGLMPGMYHWMWDDDKEKKICLGADSLDQILDLQKRALAAGVEAHLITDSGITEFGGVPTETCLCLGPDFADKIDVLTADLKCL